MSGILERIAALPAEQRAALAELLKPEPEPIAIIGIGCRFPGAADTPEAFWELLRSGGYAVTEVPPDRWNIAALYNPDPDVPGKMYTRYGAFIDHIDQFDAAFFGIAPREATSMDPQQRLLLEVAWEALEDAGQPTERLAGSRTGVFVGVCTSDYAFLEFADRGHIDAYTGSGNAHSMIANRLSYLLDLQGPSMVVDTACSSSLVAVHLGCQSLWSRESDMALVGGVQVILSPEATLTLSKARMMAPDGRCKTFDARADGYVRGEGCGVVVLKRLSDARSNGDPILALIRGSAVNQDGRTNGLTAPNGRAQQAVLRQALKQANVSPSQISYIETHGTGTALGDPIEVETLTQVIGQARLPEQPCVLGAVKTNIGHLEAAAGIASLIKVIMALLHEEIPPNLHFTTLNPNIQLEGTPFVIPTTIHRWLRGADRRLAGINSFGFGGTNGHVVLEEAPIPSNPAITIAHRAERARVLPISVRSQAALQAMITRYRAFLSNAAHAVVPLEDICYTAAVRRSHHEHRLAVVGRSHAELVAQLDQALQVLPQPMAPSTGRIPERRQGLAFVFTGQGSQWVGMGKELMEHEPVFRKALEECDAALCAHSGWSLLEELQAAANVSRLHQTEVAQPALFALQVALVALWRSWGIVPDAVVGHSVGEAAAAYVAGALSLDAAAQVIVHRARLMQQATGHGAMAAVALSAFEAERAIAERGYTDRVVVAAINSPCSVVLSGEPTALAALLAMFRDQTVRCHDLRVTYAFHSPQMEPFQIALAQALGDLRSVSPTIPMYSTVTGRQISPSAASSQPLDATYWIHNMRQRVLFAEAVAELIAAGHKLFLEIGPQPVLHQPIIECLQHVGQEGMTFPSLRRNLPEVATLLESLGALYTWGYPVRWELLYPNRRNHVQLPRYAWQHQRFWVEPSVTALPETITIGRPTTHPLLGTRIRAALQDHIFETHISTTTYPYLGDHRIYGATVVPAVFFLEMARAAATEVFGPSALRLEDVNIREALIIPPVDTQVVQIILSPRNTDVADFQILSLVPTSDVSDGSKNWRLHVTGTTRRIPADQTDSVDVLITLAAAQAHCRDEGSVAQFYQAIQAAGFTFGSSFYGIEQLWHGTEAALGRIHLSPSLKTTVDQFHPAFQDACLQVLGAALANHDAPEHAYMPIGIDKVDYYQQPGERVWSFAQLQPVTTAGSETLLSDISIFDDTGQRIVAIKGLYLKRAERSALLRASGQFAHEVQYAVVWQQKAHAAQDIYERITDARNGWIIFTDQVGGGVALVQALEAREQHCVLVSKGTGDITAADHFSIDPASPEAFQELFQRLRQTSVQTWRGIVHFWSLDVASGDGIGEAPHLRSILHLTQALATANLPGNPRLWLITREAQAVDSQQPQIAVEQTPVWGLGRTIALEHPELWGGMIDLTDPIGEVATLLREIWQPDEEKQVALRADRRYVPRLIRQTNRHRSDLAVIQPDRTYIISGGMGALGRLAAHWLIEHGAHHLVLIGRTAPEASIHEDIQSLARRAQVLCVQADVAQASDLANALADVCIVLPPIGGVIHAAGVLDDGVLIQQTWQRFANVLAPKVLGAWNLHILTRDQPLTFFVLFSSIVALLGAPSQSSYAAANAFLDGLAHYRRLQGLPAVSINWGPWAEIGMHAMMTGRFSSDLRVRGVSGLAPQLGIDMLEQVLRMDETQVAVWQVDWSTMRHTIDLRTLPILTDLIHETLVGNETAASAPPELMQRLLQTSANERRKVLSAYIRQQVSRILRLNPSSEPGIRQRLFDLGLDSLMAIELKNSLSASLGYPLRPTLVFDYPTIETLTNYLMAEVPALQELASTATGPTQAPLTTADNEVDQMIAAVAQLSDDDVARALRRRSH